MAFTTRKALWMQGQAASPVLHPAEDVRLDMAAMFAPATGPDALKVRSGVIWGPGYTGANSVPCALGSSTAGTVQIYPGRWIIQSSTALAGAYLGTIDAVQSVNIPSSSYPAAGQFKAGMVIVHLYDTVYGDAADGWVIEVLLGAAAATTGATALPAQPTNSLYLCTFTIDSAGSITFVNGAQGYTTATGTGGILPAINQADTGAFDGQYRDHPTLGIQRWSVSRSEWETKPMVYGKAWRTGAFSGVMNGVTGAVNYTVQFDTARTAGGFTFTKGPSALSTTAADTYLTVPLDGLYTIRARGYVSGGSGLSVLVQVYANSGAGAAVLGQGQIYKPDGNDRMCSLTDTFPLKAGDRLWLALAPNATGTQYWGSAEGQGIMLSAYYEGPLSGATAL